MSISPGYEVNRVAIYKLPKYCLRIIAFVKMLLKEAAKVFNSSLLVTSDNGILPSERVRTSRSNSVGNCRHTYRNSVVEPTSSYQLKS